MNDAKKLCSECKNKDTCQNPCNAVKEILKGEKYVMERQFGDTTVIYPKTKEVHFSDLEDRQIETFSEDDLIPWSSENFDLTLTKVFYERFFLKTSCKELADRFDVKENTIVCMYQQSLVRLNKILRILDSRKAGIKAVRDDRFTEDQKYFLLFCVFGFTQVEISEMFNKDKNVISQKVKRLSDKYGRLFTDEVKEETPIQDPAMKDRLTRKDVVKMVDSYVDQGLSQREAFKRIAERYQDKVKRPVSFRGIESRYYKTLAACGV